MSSGLWAENFGDVGALLKRLQQENVTTEDLAAFRADDTRRLVVGEAFRASGRRINPWPQIIALDPFGPAVFDTCDWKRLYGLVVSTIPFPWSWEVLNGPCPFNPGETVAETHFAFLGFKQAGGKSLTIEEWVKLHPHCDQSRRRFMYNALDWIVGEEFMSQTLEARWYLMLRDPTVLTAASLPPEYEVPTAIEQVTMMILASD